MGNITAFFSWYFVMLIAGWISFPLTYHFFPALSDRGYSFSKAFAWLVWGYIFWILASFGFIQNNAFSILICLMVLTAVSVWILYKETRRDRNYLSDILKWFKSHLKIVLTIEVLFFFAFLGWAFVRSTIPEALGTEKPMELAFINAILRSPTFPPHDPWLSGFSISYYHFGYILVALLAKVTSVPGSIAFNLGISLIFALSSTGIYGIIYNLLLSKAVVSLTKPPDDQSNDEKKTLQAESAPVASNISITDQREPSWRQAWGLSFLGPVFLLLASNLEGFLHSLHTRGLFWKQSSDGQLVSPFWQWLDIQDLNLPPAPPYQWVPDSYWWWWRASRVLQDYDLLGRPREIIDEFPFFSFLLADLHPHVITIPFALLAISLALHYFLKPPGGKFLQIGPVTIDLSFPELLVTALVLGSLGFLNTWDFPIYVGLFAGVYATTRVISRSLPQQSPVWSRWLKEFIISGFVLGLAGGLLFFPFYLGFSSQAGGLVVNFIYITRGTHLWVMFAILLVGIGAYLVSLSRQESRLGVIKTTYLVGLFTGLLLVFGLFIFALILGTSTMLSEELRSFYLSSMAAVDIGNLFSQSVIRRVITPGTWLTIAVLIGIAYTMLLKIMDQKLAKQSGLPKIHGFILLLILAGCLLVIFSEFFFLRDQFGWRMNTIFKFYYQAWIIWSVAASFGVAYCLLYLRRLQGILVNGILFLAILASLVYPALSLINRTNHFTPSQSGLDSTAYMESQNPDEAAAIEYLREVPFGVLAEAISPTGGSYTSYARFATLTGMPGVLGWMGHESQWRGGNDPMGTRQADITRLYCSPSFDELMSVIEQYNIAYVVLGSLERTTYAPGSPLCPRGLNEPLIREALVPIFNSGEISIFTVPGR